MRRAPPAGGLAVLPTETGYMLAADAISEAAIDAVYTAKGRPQAKPIHVAVTSLEGRAAPSTYPARPGGVARGHARALHGPRRGRGLVPDVQARHGDTRRARPGAPVTLQSCTRSAGNSRRLRTASRVRPRIPIPSRRRAAARRPPRPRRPRPPRRSAAAVHAARYVDGTWEILRQGPVTEAAITTATM